MTMLHADAPPDAPPDAPALAVRAHGRAGVPGALTTFVGRLREVAAVRQRLSAARLVTLTGAGGSGKTRLAAEVASRVASEYADGVAWLELAPLREAELLPAHLASVLGLRQDGSRPATEMIVEALRGRTMLLVLDNCEHLVDAAAQLAEALLRECPEVRILATSREPLGIAGERAWLVPALSVPDGTRQDVEAVAESEAVRLFLDRAQEVVATFVLTAANAPAVARICRRLDGLPLAIELAAAHVRVLTPEQIAQRLEHDLQLLAARTRGTATRHQTLHAAVDWSYRLLSHPEQQLLTRLSVFAGGFSLEAVEAVCGDDGLACDELLELLARLVDRSLVVMREHGGEARYGLLEVVRQFARHRLEADPMVAARVRRRHAESFVALAEAALPNIRRTARTPWMRHLDAEQDNFRAVLGWALGEDGSAELALRLVSALWWHWGQRALHPEALAWLETALRHPAGQAPSAARAHALSGAGAFAFVRGEVARARALLEESVAIWNQCEESADSVHALSTLAYVLAEQGEHAGASAHGEEAVRRARALGEPWLVALAIINGPAHARHRRGALDEADRAYAEAGAAASRDGFSWGIAEAEHRRALIALERGDVAAAGARARAAAAGWFIEDEPFPRYRALLVRAAVALREGDAALATRLCGAAEVLRTHTVALMLPFESERYDALVAEARATLGDETFREAWADGGALPIAEVLRLAAAPAQPAPAALPSAAPSTVVQPAAIETPAPPSVQPSPPPTPATPATPAPPPVLRVCALGPLVIECEGVPLPPDAFAYSRPRELLLHLLCHPEGRTRDQLGLVFWPDATPGQLKNNFHVTLHHVRKALGHADVIIYEHERYRLNWALGIEFDVRVFGAEIGAALQGSSGNDGIERLRAALAWYRGDFLEDVTAGDWHLEHRDDLRRRYVHGMLALGERLARRGDDAEAANVYRELVLREPLHEEACRRLIVCLAHTGERVQAMRHYERLATLLRTDLEAEPEPETRALYERLRRAEPI